MVFKGWQKTSLIEYPRAIATVLFTGGCNLRCPYCYNSDLVLRPESLSDLEGAAVLEYLKVHRRLYQAVVVSGGEPCLQEDLPAFLTAAKTLDLKTGLETNGSRPETLAGLISQGLLDRVALDLKGPLTAKGYAAATGLEEGKAAKVAQAVKESLRILAASRLGFELRTTVVPGILGEEELLAIAAYLTAAPPVPWVLQSFVPARAMAERLRSLKPYPPEFFARVLGRIRALGVDSRWAG